MSTANPANGHLAAAIATGRKVFGGAADPWPEFSGITGRHASASNGTDNYVLINRSSTSNPPAY
jgi:hypothetical protein